MCRCTIKDVFPIPGTKRMKYLEENVAAFSIRLTSEELKLLEDTVPASKVGSACIVWQIISTKQGLHKRIRLIAPRMLNMR